MRQKCSLKSSNVTECVLQTDVIQEKKLLKIFKLKIIVARIFLCHTTDAQSD